MLHLRVLIIGTSPVETLRLEDALQQTGSLESFRYTGFEQAQDRLPDWEEWNLVFARYSEKTGPVMLSLLAPVLRKSMPRVVFLVDPYEPLLVTRLLNIGAHHVLPLENIEEVLESSLSAVYESGRSLPTPLERLPVAEAVVEPGAFSAGSLGLENGLSRLFRASPVAVGVIRASDGICVDCNERYAQLLEWRREELIGRPSLELAIPGDVREKFRRKDNQLVEEELPSVQFERKIYTLNRQIRHVQVQLDLIDWAGEECFLVIAQDITEREQAKEKIKRLNDELERTVLIRTGALEAANRELAAEITRRKYLEDFSNQLNQVIWETPDVVAIFAPDGRMQFLNKAGRKLFDLTQEEPVSHLNILSGYPEELARRVREEIQPRVVKAGIWHGETEFLLADGRVIPISQVMLCQKDDDGSVLYFVTMSRDVSDFKMVERMLRVSRERYRTLAEAAHDMIFMVTRDGLMEYANRYACQAMGIEPTQVEGMPANRFFPQDFAANHFQMFGEVHEIDQPVYTEGPFMREGGQFWLGTWLVPIHDEQNHLTSILGISRDITEQKKTDEALQRALQNERRLGEMRSNFFSMTSHQFRTPLSTILLSTELLQRYGSKWDEAKRSEHLGRIQESARRLNGMLEDILLIGRVESGRYVCTPKEFDLIDFCGKSVAEIIRNDREAHVIAFDHDGLDRLPVFQDPEVVHRVVDNLLSNAVKYSPLQSCVSMRIRMEDQNVIMEVSDQGIGIPERDLKYLFQPFQRGSNAADIPGTGIGLTIIQKSIDLMNGSVSLKSKEGQGTTFMVRFPARLKETRDDQIERMHGMDD